MRTPAPVSTDVAPSRLGLHLATTFGLGNIPRIPGTVASLVAVAVFGALHRFAAGAALEFGFLVVLAGLVPLALWSTEHALRHWKTPDPQVIVIDEVAGQWLTYGGLVLAPLLGWPARPGWKSLLLGFILFRAFDVVKPFPIRRSERLAGAAGVVVDDLLAGLYAAALLLVAAGSGWLR